MKHVPYQGVELTELGREEALREIRRHRILEVFLVNVMGFTWDETHEHADDLSAGLNDRLTERMAEMTGQPTRCPHGEPIPDLEGRLPVVTDVCIVNLGVGHRGAVSRVRTHEPEKLRYFASLGLVPGVAVAIMGRAPLNRPANTNLETVPGGPGREQTLAKKALHGHCQIETFKDIEAHCRSNPGRRKQRRGQPQRAVCRRLSRRDHRRGSGRASAAFKRSIPAR